MCLCKNPARIVHTYVCCTITMTGIVPWSPLHVTRSAKAGANFVFQDNIII